MKLKQGFLEKVFIDNAFYIFNFAAFVSTFLYNIRTGAVCSVIIIIGLLCYLWREKKIMKDALFILFVFFNIFSVIWYAFNGESIWFFFSGISYNLIPSLLFIIGYSIDGRRMDKILDTVFYSNFIITAIGLFFYLTNKTFYFSVMDTEFRTTYTYAHKFGSYLTCLVFGSMCVIQVGLTLYRLFRNRNNVFTFITIPITLYALLINMERGAWLATAVLLIVVIFILASDRKGIRYAIMTVFIIVIVWFAGRYFIENYLNSDVFKYLTNRLNSMSNVFSSRNDQIEKAIETFLQYPLGYGLGAAGNKAALNGGTRIVPDGNYFRILVELGVFGFFTFIILLARGIVRGIRGDFLTKILVAIVIAFAAHASGSNVFDFFYSSYFFWLLLGFLSRPNTVNLVELNTPYEVGS